MFSLLVFFELEREIFVFSLTRECSREKREHGNKEGKESVCGYESEGSEGGNGKGSEDNGSKGNVDGERAIFLSTDGKIISRPDDHRHCARRSGGITGIADVAVAAVAFVAAVVVVVVVAVRVVVAVVVVGNAEPIALLLHSKVAFGGVFFDCASWFV